MSNGSVALGMVLVVAAMLVGAVISRSINKMELFSPNFKSYDDESCFIFFFLRQSITEALCDHPVLGLENIIY